MGFRNTEFRRRYVATGGSPNSAASYASYLNRLNGLCGDIDGVLAAKGADHLLRWSEDQPNRSFGGERNKRDCLSAIRKYVTLLHRISATDRRTPAVAEPCGGGGWSRPHLTDPRTPALAEPPSGDAGALHALLADARTLGARYYRLTGRPLGVTGEVAELAAAQALGVELALARQSGFDGWVERNGQRLRVQIKGRAVAPERRYIGRCPSIRCGDLFDICLLVLLDQATMDMIEIWEASELSIAERLGRPGSKARNERNSLGISQFKSIAQKVWPVV